ncbi:MAG TPA: hypothetical protein VNL71_22840, partial [Chloroflexota bacterium]|nr:hypothetical protein [Chloroflexota bacterium]
MATSQRLVQEPAEMAGQAPLRLAPKLGGRTPAAKTAREHRLGLVISALVAALTAVGLGLLIATTASAARSAAA